MPLVEKVTPAIAEKRELVCSMCGKGNCDGKLWWYQDYPAYTEGPYRHIICSNETQMESCSISLQKIDEMEGVPFDVKEEMRKKVPKVRYTKRILVAMCCYNSYRAMEYKPEMGKLWISKGWKKTDKDCYVMEYSKYHAIYNEHESEFHKKIHIDD